jgi:glutaconyl-CoA/methylmalonyl-CoA decarboxylase subunit gamma
MKLTVAGQPRELDVEIVSREGGEIRATVDGKSVVAQLEPLTDGGAILTVDGRRYRAFGGRRKGSILVTLGPRSFEFVPADESPRRRRGGLTTPEVTAPMPGKVLKVLVSEGDAVEAGQALVVLEAMKMETTLAAESPAVVRRVRVIRGQMVDHGAVLIELSPPAGPSAPESAAPDH